MGKNDPVEKMLLIFWSILIFTITYTIALKLLGLSELGSDYYMHAKSAASFSTHNFLDYYKTNAYPMWHFITKLNIKILRIPMEEAAALTSGVINMITYFIVYYIYNKFLDTNISRKIVSSLVFVLLIVEPIYISWYNQYLYLGQGSPNVWHNPTNPMVRPFAVIIFYMFLTMYKRYKNNISHTKMFKSSEVLVLAILMILSQLAKPSFLQIFIPGLGIFLLIELISSKGKSFLFCLKIACICIPSVILIIVQYIISFYYSVEDTGIAFGWLEVAKAFAPNAYISVLLVIVFPLFVIITDFKKLILKKDIQFSIILLAVGWLEYASLVEEGARKYHGNFSWGYLISLFIIWMVTLVYFIKYTFDSENFSQKKYKFITYIGWSFLFLHFICGIYYISLFFTQTNFVC